MPDYQKGKIYKLWSPQGNEIYIGSTINPLAKRLGQHKNHITCRSRYLFENYDDVRIELIELYPCDSKIELNKKEGEHIRNNECLNKKIAGRTHEEWCEDNKEYMKEYFKEYYENNKEHKKECMKEYRENNKEDIKEKKKEWCENNKEHIKEQQKNYYENNKEKLNEKFVCECGGKCNYQNKLRHFKTKKHLAFMNSHQ